MGTDADKDKDKDADFGGKKTKGKVVKRKYNLPLMIAEKKSKKGKFVRSGRKKTGDDTAQKMIDAAKRELQENKSN